MNSLITPAREAAAAITERVARIRELYDAGLYLQAWELGREWGPLQAWPGVEARILASRLGYQLGASRLSDWLCRCAFKRHPTHAEAKYFFAYVRLRRRGPYVAWRWWRENAKLPEGGSNEIRASWIALWGEVAATLRDFETAERHIREALEIDPASAWARICQAGVLQAQDRYDESLSAAREALALRPWYRPAVQHVGHLLTLRDQDDEALNFLTEASEKIECAGVSATHFAQQLEAKQYEAASRTLDRVEQLFPLADKWGRKWFASQRAEVAYYLGDYDAAIRFAEASDSDFHKTVAERLKDESRRSAPVATLPVGFVRQHHHTCGPATLSAISRYWQQPADHLNLVDEICYDGTTSYSERKWALDHGWAVREFSVTEESTRELIDRGVPFTFTTVDPGGGHLQAIIGYDARRGTLIIRDPYWRTSGEALADKLLQRHRAYGPRGMVLVPLSHQEKLEGVSLPDAELWDDLFALDAALETHRRPEATPVAERMEARAPEHRLALEARRRLAIYDGNTAAHLAVVEKLLEPHPDCATLQLERLSLLRHHAKRDDRLAIYRKLCANKETHPVFWQRFAQELCDDARQRDETLWLLRRAIRRWPSDPVSYFLLANVYWSMRRFDEALELYRFAACLNDKDEQFAMSYFTAAQWFKQGESVLALLRDRFARLGKKSSLPVRTLASALFQIERDEEALQAIEEAIRQRPDDGSLLLHAADAQVQASAERMERSRELLSLASDKVSRPEWLNTAARLAETDGKLHEALAQWRELAEFQPLHMGAQRSVVRLLAATESNAAALAHLQAACERFPHYLPLFELYVEWLREEPNPVREPVLRRGVELFADNAWLHRELAFLLLDERHPDEARKHTDIAGQLDPLSPAWNYLEAELLRRAGQPTEARAMLRQAVEQSVDNDFAVAKLMESCLTLTERREAIAFLKEQLVKQVIFGDGLLSFREHARGTLEDEELLTVLEEARAERPDLWHAWSACVQQLLSLNRPDQAWELCQQANKRFPLLPRLWIDRSYVCRARLDDSSEEEALRTALQINPAWSLAVRALADVYERQHKTQEAAHLLRHAAARNPLDPALQHVLAETLWRLDQKEEAIGFTQRAIRLEPGYDRAWDYLHYWAGELDKPELALNVARGLTDERGGEARSWLVLARLLDKPEQRDERLAAIDKAIELNPQCVDAYDQKAKLFAAEEKWQEAQEACHPPAWNGPVPSDLRARAAWIEAERGELQTAIEKMELVVEDEPGYYGAWSKLADWSQQAGDQDRYLRAAEALVRINPQYEVSLGYLGEARYQKGDKAGAREALARAFELEPRYEFAGNMLFDLQMEAEEFDQAQETVARLREHSSTPYVLGRQAQVAGKRKEVEPILEALNKVVRDPEAIPWALETTVEAVEAAACVPQAVEILEAVLAEEQLHPHTAAQWVHLRVSQGAWPTPQRLREFVERGELGERAVGAYVEEIRRANDLPRLVALQQENAAWLRANTFCWASVGRGFGALYRYDLGTPWLAEWRAREDAQPWMLVNAAECLRGVGRIDEAIACSQRAILLPPAHGQHIHHLLLGCDAAVAGQIDQAVEHLASYKRHNPGNEDIDHAFLRQMTEAIVELSNAEPAARPALFSQQLTQLAEARAAHPDYHREPERQRLYGLTRQRLAQIRGGLVGTLYGWWFAIALRDYSGGRRISKPVSSRCGRETSPPSSI